MMSKTEIIELRNGDHVRRVNPGSEQEKFWREKGYTSEVEKAEEKPKTRRTRTKKDENPTEE